MIYRIKQFVQGINAKVTNNDIIFLNKYLTENEKKLFFQLRISEQRHSLNVAYGCVTEMPNNYTLIRAAILHDIGKIGSNLTLINKSFVVIAMGLKISPKCLPRFLKQALDYKLNHGELGYKLLQDITSDEKLLMLVKNHHYPEKFQSKEMSILVHHDNLN